MSTTTPRCPEYNRALELLQKDCDDSQHFYGFTNIPFDEVSSSSKIIIDDMLKIFEAKDTDYASNGKPMGNLRSSEELGVPAWKGTLLRMGDKKQRIASFASRGEFLVKDEHIADTLKDLANYACLGSVLFQEVYQTTNSEYLDIVRHFHNLALCSIHCKLLSEYSEKHSNIMDWRAKPLAALNTHFDAIAAFARSN